MYVTTTTHWEFVNVRFAAIEDFGASRGPEAEENVGTPILALFNGCGAGSGIGHIKNPAGTQKWPPT